MPPGGPGCFYQNNHLVSDQKGSYTIFLGCLQEIWVLLPFRNLRTAVGEKESLFKYIYIYISIYLYIDIYIYIYPQPERLPGAPRSPGPLRARLPVLVRTPAPRVQAAAQPQRDGRQPPGAGPGEPRPALRPSLLGGSAGTPPAWSAGRRRRSRRVCVSEG